MKYIYDIDSAPSKEQIYNLFRIIICGNCEHIPSCYCRNNARCLMYKDCCRIVDEGNKVDGAWNYCAEERKECLQKILSSIPKHLIRSALLSFDITNIGESK